jgi:hypothetical protein
MVLLNEGRMNTQKYIRMVLEGPLADFVQEMEDATGELYDIMEDNVPCHTAKTACRARER